MSIPLKLLVGGWFAPNRLKQNTIQYSGAGVEAAISAQRFCTRWRARGDANSCSRRERGASLDGAESSRQPVALDKLGHGARSWTWPIGAP